MRLNKMKRPITRESRRFEGGIARVADFLNMKFGSDAIGNFERQYQNEFFKLINPIVVSVSQEEAAKHLQKLIDRLHSGSISLHFVLSRVNPETLRPRSKAKVMRIGNSDWIVEEKLGFRDPGNIGHVYVLQGIASSLLSGEFGRLRKCPGCLNFFATDDLRAEFCSDKCKTDFNYKQRMEAGYYKKYQRERREKIRQKKKDRASETIKRKEVRYFEKFLKKAAARSGSKEQMEVGGFIRKRLKWKTVDPWLEEWKAGKSPGQIWDKIPNQTRAELRTFWEETAGQEGVDL